MKKQYDEASKRIWESYQIYAKHSFVLRSGHFLIGAARQPVLNDYPNESELIRETFLKRGESDLEHQAKMAWLCSVFANNYREFFFGVDYFEKTDSDHLAKGAVTNFEKWLFTIIGLIHDTGETVDIPDDGNTLHGTNDAEERAIIEHFVKAYLQVTAFRLMNRFDDFQSKDTHRGKALFTLDKLEAVLTLLYLEKHGCCGYITNKPNITERDSRTMKIIESTCATDCWATQMVEQIKNYPPEIVDPVLSLLNVATIDVRGEKFPWLDMVLAMEEPIF